jgi:formylglycine-generating enzyme required for sulfatase activity
MGWEPPPRSCPRAGDPRPGPGPKRGGLDATFYLHEENKIRRQYCEDATVRALDWHAHDPTGQLKTHFGVPPRDDPNQPWLYDRKPMVSVSWQEAEALCARLTTAHHLYWLPTEAEWEKAARGGLIGCGYPWGDEPPSETRCDYDRFDQFSILPMRRFPANDYGLYAMSGGIWEWTSDWYDAQSYAPGLQPAAGGPDMEQQRVLRGGSWSDCADVVTVSFRMSRGSRDWQDGQWGAHLAPNIGFRLCRVDRG